MDLEVSKEIDRPVADVFRFFAEEHVRNHPRWDPDVELEQVGQGPLGKGSIVRRRVSRGGKAVEGAMEVVAFEPGRLFGTRIQDGPVESRGRATFAPLGAARTLLTIGVELPGPDEPELASRIRGLMERSAGNIKRLVEDEPR